MHAAAAAARAVADDVYSAHIMTARQRRNDMTHVTVKHISCE